MPLPVTYMGAAVARSRPNAPNGKQTQERPKRRGFQKEEKALVLIIEKVSIFQLN
jgi:hypothetical protein